MLLSIPKPDRNRNGNPKNPQQGRASKSGRGGGCGAGHIAQGGQAEGHGLFWGGCARACRCLCGGLAGLGCRRARSCPHSSHAATAGRRQAGWAGGLWAFGGNNGAAEKRLTGGAGAFKTAGRTGTAGHLKPGKPTKRRKKPTKRRATHAPPPRPARRNAPAPPACRCCPAPPRAPSPPPRLPAVAALAALRARPSTAVPEPRQAPAQATARTRTAAPQKPMPFSLPALGILPSPATAPPATFGRAPLLGVFRVAGSGSLGGRAGIAISMPPAACAWCVCLVRVPGACAWCVCLVRVPGAWCGVVLSLHALQGVD